MNRSVLALAIALVFCPWVPLTDASAANIKPARGSWDTGWFHTAIYIKALEALGHNVQEPLTLDDAARFLALDQGDADFSVMEWFPLFNEKFATTSNLVKVGYVVKAGALQGYLVDKATAEKHDIDNLEDFKDPEVAKLFDVDGNGTADMVACPPGWDCGLVIEHHMQVYGLQDHIDLITAGYAPAMADLIARYNNGEPVFFYTWTPNWTVGVLKPGEDVVWVEVPFPSLPEGQEEYEDASVVPGVKGCGDPCSMGHPANDIRPVANSSFLQANPDVRRLFEVMSIPLEAIFEQNAKMHEGEDNPEDVERHAEEWIAENRETFDGWIAEAKAELN